MNTFSSPTAVTMMTVTTMIMLLLIVSVVTASTIEQTQNEYIPGTNLRRKLNAPSGSGAAMVIIVGYSMDRIESDCDQKFHVNNKDISVNELIVNDAKYIAKRDSPNGILGSVPLEKMNRGNKSGDAASSSSGRRNGDRDLAATVAFADKSEEEKQVADHDHRELTCQCSPGGNCEVCCLAFCESSPWYDCMAGNQYDPCNVRRRKLEDITYTNVEDEMRRLQDINYAKTIAKNYAFELQITARMLHQQNNLCLGSNPDDIWVTVEVWENGNENGGRNNRKIEGSFVP